MAAHGKQQRQVSSLLAFHRDDLMLDALFLQRAELLIRMSSHCRARGSCGRFVIVIQLPAAQRALTQATCSFLLPFLVAQAQLLAP